MARRLFGMVATVAHATLLTGCSLLFYGVASVVGSVGIGVTAEDSESEEAARVMAPIYGLIGVAYLYSAYVGFRETSRCSKIHSDAEARGVYGPQYYQPQPYYPQPYYPQPYPPQPYPPPQPPPPPPQ